MCLEFACQVQLWGRGPSVIDLIPEDLLMVPQGPPIIRDWLFVSNCGIAFHRGHLSYNLPFSGKGNKKPQENRKQRGKQYLRDINYTGVFFQWFERGTMSINYH